MNIHKTILSILMLTFVLQAQPSWGKNTPVGYLNDYFVGRGIGTTKTEATQNAYEDAVVAILRNSPFSAQASRSSKAFLVHRKVNDSLQLEIVRNSVQELRFEGESKTIKQLKLAETYYEQNSFGYEAWVLLFLPKKDPIPLPSTFSPVWRSVLLPGWGQLYNSDRIKGIAFTITTIGAVTGGIVFNELSTDAANKAFSSRTQARRDYYNLEKKDFAKISIVCYIIAGVLYTWNVIDAVTVTPDYIYVQIDPKTSSPSLNLTIKF